MAILLPKEDGIYRLTCPDHSTAPVRVTLSATSNVSSQLTAGEYLISTTAECQFLQGPSTVTANANCRTLYAGRYIPLSVGDTTERGYVAGYLATGTGYIEIAKI